MKAKLTKPSKTAMQSGKAKSAAWLLEFLPDSSYFVDPLMGWTGMSDTKREVRINFDTKDAALAYAKSNNIEIELCDPAPQRTKKRAYADNFKFDKKTG